MAHDTLNKITSEHSKAFIQFFGALKKLDFIVFWTCTKARLSECSVNPLFSRLSYTTKPVLWTSPADKLLTPGLNDPCSFYNFLSSKIFFFDSWKQEIFGSFSKNTFVSLVNCRGTSLFVCIEHLEKKKS